MKAIILAAGRGSRLGNITSTKPKPMAKLVGIPLIEWQLNALKDADIQDVSIVTGYEAEAFNAYHLPTFNNPHWATTNMVSSLLCADKLLSNNDAIVSYGDIVYKPSIVKKLVVESCQLGITFDTKWLDLWKLRFKNPLDDAEQFRHKNGYLQAIGKKVKSLNEIDGQYMGLIKITSESWKEIKRYLINLPASELQAKDMTTLLNDLIIKGHSIKTVAIEGGWVEVDNPSDIACYEQLLLTEEKWSHDWRK